MKVFVDDHKLGDLWCLKICSCLEGIDKIVRYAEGERVSGFAPISDPLCDLIVELELLAVLTETKAPLLEPLEPIPDFDSFELRIEKLIDERDEELKRRMTKSGKTGAAPVAEQNDDRQGILELISICRRNFKRIEDGLA